MVHGKTLLSFPSDLQHLKPLLVQKFIGDIPGVLAVLQDMTRTRPDARLNAMEAYLRMSAAIEAIAESIKDKEVPRFLLEEYEEVPPRMNLYIYGFSPYWIGRASI